MSISASRFLSAVKAHRALLLALVMAAAASPVHAQSTGFSSLSDNTPFSGTYTPAGTTKPTTATIFSMTASTLTTNFKGPVQFGGWVGIGIGTANPTAPLDILGANTGVSQSNAGALLLQANDGLNRPAVAVYGNIDGVPLVDTTASALAVREQSGTGRSITTSGTIAVGGAGSSSYIMSNVGIGTTTAPYALTVVGPDASLGQGGQAMFGTGKSYWAVDNFDGAGNWLVSNTGNKAWSAIGAQDDQSFLFSINGNWVGNFDTSGGFTIGCGVGLTPANYGTYTATISTSNSCAPGGTGSYLIVAGNAYVAGQLWANGQHITSDQRLKTDIHPIANALDKLLALRGVEFSWKQDGRADMGVVAQDVEKVFPNIVAKKGDSEGTLSVEYNALIGPTIEAIRQLKSENDEMKARLIEMNGEMKAQLIEMKAEIKALKEQQIHSIKAGRQDDIVKPSAVIEQ